MQAFTKMYDVVWLCLSYDSRNEIRQENGRRCLIFQVWDFVTDVYDLSMYFVIDDKASAQPATYVMRSKYYAIETDRVMGLMEKAGFKTVERLDGYFFQTVLVGDKI